jgi:hypothetical protein
MKASLINPRLDDFFRDLAERVILVGPVEHLDPPSTHWHTLITGRLSSTSRLCKITLEDQDQRYVLIARTTVILAAIAFGVRVHEWTNRAEYVEKYRLAWPHGVPPSKPQSVE